MKYTAQEEYGLRCMLQLARNEAEGSLTIDEIARSEGITPHYAGKLLRILMKGGLIESTRGKQGGYSLDRSSVDISVGEVLNVLGGRLYDGGNCQKFTGILDKCSNTNDCSVRALWSTLDRIVDNVLSRTMLKDLIDGERSVNLWLKQSGVQDDINMEKAFSGDVAL